MTMNHGALLISLDFELYWGVRDKRSLQSYRRNLEGVHDAIPRMLEVFREFGIHATWATVGLLFCRDAEEARRRRPAERPAYDAPGLCPYRYLDTETDLPASCHFSPELIDLIASVPNQEIATHTFSHYYCRESGQTLHTFVADLQAAIAVSADRGHPPRSIVFPRNQWNADYLSVLPELGIQCYRGNEPSWCYRAVDKQRDNVMRRAGRFLDTYVNLCGHQTYRPARPGPGMPYDFPSSRLLRPRSRRLAALEGLRLRRIRQSLRHAARKGEVFHLWWHPHNFGVETAANVAFLAEVLKEFSILRDRYGMQSLTMAELCQSLEAPACPAKN